MSANQASTPAARLARFADWCRNPREEDDDRLSAYINGEDGDVADDLQVVLAQAALATEAISVLGAVLSADREALANHGPKWGLADCIDNAGTPYQSAGLAATLETARNLVARAKAAA